MRLFYFVTDIYPTSRVDLTELFGKELQQLGLDTTWSMRRGAGGRCTRVSANGQTVYLPFAVTDIRIIGPIIRRLGELVSEIALMLKLIFGPRYDIIQVRDNRYTAALFAWIAARLRGCRFVYWVSFPFPESDLEMAILNTSKRRQFMRLRGVLTRWWLYKVVLPRADHIFVQSERMKTDISAYGLAPERMTPVPMGVPPRLFAFAEVAGNEIETGRVVYLGTLSRQRRLETVIEAFARVLEQVPHARLYLIGKGVFPGDRANLEDMCARLQIADSVTFTGLLPIEQAWSMAAQADVCVSPIYPSASLLPGSPTKLYEYMALGRPVVANDHPEQVATLAESGAGLCVPWGAENFAKAIVYLLTHPDAAHAMGARGPAWVAAHRRYDRLAELVYRRYQALLATT